MALETRKPTGKPSWPIGLLAGVEKSGKSYACAQASGSPVIGQTLWVGIGEDDPDEYGAVPGARFDIVVHDGSYQSILWAFRDAVTAPTVDGKPTLLVGDSMTRLWNLIVDNAQAVANQRAKGRKKAGSDDYTITADLWNQAAKQWKDVMDAVRAHRGPVLLTARLDEVAIMEGGQPTGERTWKVQGHKSLPFDVGFIVQMRERGQYLLTGTRSVVMGLQEPTAAPGWTAPQMWQAMGVDPSTVADRRHSETVTDAGEEGTSTPRPAQQQAPRPQAPQQLESGRDWEAELYALTSPAQVNPLYAEIPRDHPNRKVLLEKFREHGLKLRAQQAPAGQPEQPAGPGWAQPAQQQAPQPAASAEPQELPQEPSEQPGDTPAPAEAERPAEVAPPAAEAPAQPWVQGPGDEGPSDDGDVPPEDDGPMALDGLAMPEQEPQSNGHTL